VAVGNLLAMATQAKILHVASLATVRLGDCLLRMLGYPPGAVWLIYAMAIGTKICIVATRTSIWLLAELLLMD
jgi:hypothetical protein